MTTTEGDLPRLAKSYADAWTARDVDRVLSLQDDEMVFHMHLEGYPPTRGRTALRAQYEAILAAIPDYGIEVHRIRTGPALIVIEYVLTGTLEGPFPLGDELGLPSGHALHADAVDVFEAAGEKMTRRDTYLDGLTLRKQMGL